MENTYEIDGEKYITLKEFSDICNKTEKRIIERYKEIPVIKNKDGKYYVLCGTRYPISIKKFTIKDDWDRKYALLKAISQRKYIDNRMIGLYQKEFKIMLGDLLQVGLIREESIGNEYGANAYVCTDEGLKLIKRKKGQIISYLTNLLAEASGKFAGEIFSRINNQ